jgi:hypothetical protein
MGMPGCGEAPLGMPDHGEAPLSEEIWLFIERSVDGDFFCTTIHVNVTWIFDMIVCVWLILNYVIILKCHEVLYCYQQFPFYYLLLRVCLLYSHDVFKLRFL